MKTLTIKDPYGDFEVEIIDYHPKYGYKVRIMDEDFYLPKNYES